MRTTGRITLSGGVGGKGGGTKGGRYLWLPENLGDFLVVPRSQGSQPVLSGGRIQRRGFIQVVDQKLLLSGCWLSRKLPPKFLSKMGKTK